MIQNGDLTQKLKKEKTITTHHSLSGFPLPIEQQSAFFQIFECLEDTQILLRSCPRIHQSEGIHFDGPRRMAGAWRMAHGCAMSATPSGLSRIFLQALMIAHPWKPCLQPKFLLLNLPDMFCTGQPGQEASFFANLS
jgi:hypothetical protein